MPRRNQKINASQAYWIKKSGSSKGFSVYSEKQLNQMIEDGKITEADIVQIRVSKGN
jgi:hypothetical protein